MYLYISISILLSFCDAICQYFGKAYQPTTVCVCEEKKEMNCKLVKPLAEKPLTYGSVGRPVWLVGGLCTTKQYCRL